ncbi:MAG: DUF2997 domain-containing protein [Thermoguttaceae bacterium]
MKTITLIIAPDGTTKVETNGFDGQSCKDASTFIEHALGHTTAEQFKSEYFHANNINQQQETQQC